MDPADESDRHIEAAIAEGLDQARRRTVNIAAGEAGVCLECDGYSPRLISGRCARCRDLLKLP